MRPKAVSLILVILALTLCPFMFFQTVGIGHGDYFIGMLYCPLGTVCLLLVAAQLRR